MSGAPHYFYLGGDRVHSGQYISLLRLLEREGLTVDFISCLPIRWRSLLTAWGGVRAIGPNPASVVRQRIAGRLHFLSVPDGRPRAALPWLIWLLRAGWGGRRPVVVHAKQLRMARLAVAARRVLPGLRVISEIEGDPIAELEYSRSRKPELATDEVMRRHAESTLAQEREIVLGSDRVLCVSKALRALVCERQGLTDDQAKKLHIFRSLATSDEFRFSAQTRAETRRALGVQDRFVVIYSGNLNTAWQLPERLVTAFALIRQSRPEAIFLVVTPDTDRRFIEEPLRAAGLPAASYRIRSCPHTEVPGHLCAADVGLLLRERHRMNEVASPGKFAEYALCGLPLILTAGIGDFSDAMTGSRYACVLSGVSLEGADREALQRFAAADFTDAERASFSTWSTERFSMESQIPMLAGLYRSLAEEKV